MKLNLGCGYEQPKGWDNLDVLDYGQEYVMDVRHQLPDKQYDLIVANHVLHMFNWQELDKLLLDLLSILKKGGVLRIIEFDPLEAFKSLQYRDAASLVIPDDVETSLHGKFCKYLTWYSTRKSIITNTYMIELLRRAGFREAYSSAFGKPLDSRPDESWFVEGVR